MQREMRKSRDGLLPDCSSWNDGPIRHRVWGAENDPSCGIDLGTEREKRERVILVIYSNQNMSLQINLISQQIQI